MITMTEISLSELREICIRALLNKGATPDEARVVFEDYLDAEMRGRLSHGFVSFQVALGAFPHHAKFEVIRQSPSTIEIEGNGDCGHSVSRAAIDLALNDIETIKSRIIGIRNITRFNCPGPIARYAAERGVCAIVLEYGGQNFMVPYGGTKAALSTNPIGIAVPGAEPPFVLDIATSERAIGYVNLAKMDGISIPPAWGVDKDGHPTSDPNTLAAVSPFGGYKGYGIALAVEILAGALVGVGIGSKGQLARRGALIVLVDPSAFGHTRDSFGAQVSMFLEEVIETQAADASRPVTYPGLDGSRRGAEIASRGRISVPESVLSQLRHAVAA